MSKFQLANPQRKIKTIRKLEARILSLSKAVATLPTLCDCETKYSHAEELALAEQLAGLWEREFQEELRTGIRASIDNMDPSKKAEIPSAYE